jgi:hypothetical protein
MVALLAMPSAMKLVIEESCSLKSCSFSDQKPFPNLNMLHRPRLTYSKVKVGKAPAVLDKSLLSP